VACFTPYRPQIECLEDRCLLSGNQPSAVEQLMLEELNDARADPHDYGVSINLPAIENLPAVQPLAFNTLLVQSAQGHSQDMNQNNFFSHTGSDGTSPSQRATNVGFNWTAFSESIAAGSADPAPADALASLIIDAGEPDLGHRNQLLAIDSLDQLETQVGIGIVQNGTGNLTNYYTIDSGVTPDTRPFILGVVFTDTAGSGHYAIGEGMGGVTITVSASGNPIASTTTFGSGGYSIQVAPGSYTVTASGGPLTAPIVQSVVVGAQNVRTNFVINPAPPPQSFQFGQLAYFKFDTAGQAMVTVNRVGGSSGAATVNYATSDGSAIANTDYTPTSGTLSFASGQTSASFNVGILGDSKPDYPETLQLTMSNPTGGVILGTPATTLTIVDPNISDDTVYVDSIFQDILGRPVDPSGLANFQSFLDSFRNQSLLSIAASFVVSPEARGDFIIKEYQALLGRTPGQAEVNGWVNALEQGQTPEQIVTAIVGSSEFFGLVGNNNANWLNQLYADALKRTPDPSAQGFVAALAAGIPRGVIAGVIFSSTEYRADLISGVYKSLLGLAAGPADINSWLGLLGLGSSGPGTAGPDEQFEAQVLASNEYFQRSGNLIPAWVNSLYTNLLSRAGDSGGVNGFVQAIIAAETPARSAIANALQLSGEYRSHLVAGYYNQYLFRQPVGAEAAVWIHALQSGATDEQVMTGFVTSGEYFQKHGGTNTTYINALYQDLLGRARDPNDMGFLNGLNNGTFTRSQVVSAILGSSEYRQHLVVDDYLQFLGRSPSNAEITGKLALIAQGATDEQVALQFIDSGEYYQRLRLL
jgi:hypothetical protein